MYPLAILYVLTNLFVFIVSLFPASLQNTLHTKSRVVPSFVGPVVTISCFVAGVVYWLWDRHILRILGCRLYPRQEQKDGLTVHMTFDVSRSCNSWWNLDHPDQRPAASEGLRSEGCHRRITLVNATKEPVEVQVSQSAGRGRINDTYHAGKRFTPRDLLSMGQSLQLLFRWRTTPLSPGKPKYITCNQQGWTGSANKKKLQDS